MKFTWQTASAIASIVGVVYLIYTSKKTGTAKTKHHCACAGNAARRDSRWNTNEKTGSKCGCK